MTRQSGFTLIEIMVVVVIIGLLSALVTVNVIGRLVDARVETAKTDIRTISGALALYKLDNYKYPSTEAGIEALVERPAPAEAPNWKNGGYLRKLPIDPWGNKFEYENSGQLFELYSLGSDGKPGGEDEAADIYWSDL